MLLPTLLAAGLLAPAAAGAQGGAPAFTELTGAAGCLYSTAYLGDTGGCGRASGIDRAHSVIVSPDDRFVHVASGGTVEYGSNGVATFRRDAGSGALDFAGCVSAGGGDGRAGSEGACEAGDALIGASDIAITEDGRRAYVASIGSNGVAAFDRDPATGALEPLSCVKDVKRRDRCTEAPPLLGARAVAVSPDGADVYVAAGIDGAIHALRPDAETGALETVQCLAQTGLDGLCERAGGLRAVRDLLVSPAGGEVYAVGRDGVMAVFSRDAATGRLTPAGCLLHDAPDRGPCQKAPGLGAALDLAVSPDGRDVYVAAGDEYGTVTSFRRGDDGKLGQTGCLQYVPPPEPEEEEAEEEEEEIIEDEDGAGAAQDEEGPEPGCSAVPGYVNSFGEIAVSADGGTVIAGGGDTVALYRRDRSSGVLTPAGCAGFSGFDECVELTSLETTSVDSLALTSDGRNLYVASAEGKLTVFGASVAIASAAVRAGRGGRVRVGLSCPAARARPCAGRVSLRGGAAGRAYTLRPGARGRVALRLGRTARRRLARRGAIRMVAEASDARRHLAPVARKLSIVRRGGGLRR